jgi:protein-S-isoprenylcysteine O-methyltransferase Ste14
VPTSFFAASQCGVSCCEVNRRLIVLRYSGNCLQVDSQFTAAYTGARSNKRTRQRGKATNKRKATNVKVLSLVLTVLIAAVLMVAARELTALIATDAMAVLKVILFVALGGFAVYAFRANNY